MSLRQPNKRNAEKIQFKEKLYTQKNKWKKQRGKKGLLEGSTSEHLPRNKALVNMLLKTTTSQLKYEGNTSINQEIYF